MWNIAIQPVVGCYNSWANLRCSGCYPPGEKLLWNRSISSSCTISMLRLRNDYKCKYYFTYPKINSTWQGLKGKLWWYKIYPILWSQYCAVVGPDGIVFISAMRQMLWTNSLIFTQLAPSFRFMKCKTLGTSYAWLWWVIAGKWLLTQLLKKLQSLVNIWLIGPWEKWYRKTSNISCCLVCNKIVDHSDVVDLIPGFNGLGKGNCKTRRETFMFCDLVRLIQEVLR